MALNLSRASDKTFKYRLGSNRNDYSEEHEDGRKMLESIFEDDSHIHLKKMNETERGKYLQETQDGNIPKIRKAVGSKIHDTGNVTIDNESCSVVEFMQLAPLPLILDIHMELSKSDFEGKL